MTASSDLVKTIQLTKTRYVYLKLFGKKIDKGEVSCGIFLDLQKAFDSVDHDILLTKLEYYGFRGVTIKWIRSYLCERKQYVSLETVSSKSMPINYGVPQGSVLSPLFFLLYINDLQKCLKHSKSFICG